MARRPAAPDQSCSNVMKTTGFMIQGSKSTVTLLVLATLAGGRETHVIKTVAYKLISQKGGGVEGGDFINICVFGFK